MGQKEDLKKERLDDAEKTVAIIDTNLDKIKTENAVHVRNGVTKLKGLINKIKAEHGAGNDIEQPNIAQLLKQITAFNKKVDEAIRMFNEKIIPITLANEGENNKNKINKLFSKNLNLINEANDLHKKILNSSNSELLRRIFTIRNNNSIPAVKQLVDGYEEYVEELLGLEKNFVETIAQVRETQ